MKNSILLFLLLSFSFSGFSQLVFEVNGELIENEQEFVFNTASAESNLVVNITNNNDNAIGLRLLFEEVNATDETTEFEFCIGSCYWLSNIENGEIFPALSGAAYSIGAGETTGDGDIHFHNHYAGSELVSYNLKLYDEDDEENSFVKFTYTYDSNSAVENIITNDFLSVYPNPANNVLYLTNKNNTAKDYTIFDISGKNIISGKISKEKSQISVSHIPAGMYFLQVNTEGQQSETHKVIIK